MSDVHFETHPSQEGFSNAPAPNGSPNQTNVFFQLIKGLCYFLLFIASQVLATYVLMFYYVFKIIAELNSNAGFDVARIADTAMQVTDEAIERVLSDSNGLLLAYGVILVIFLLIFFALRKKSFLAETRFQKFSPKYLPAMALLTLGFYFFIDAILNFLPKSMMESYAESSSFINDGSFVFSIITQALIAPLTEELTFRGLMLSRFDKALPKWIGISISSLLFGLVHGNPVWFVYAATLGYIFCIVAECTGSIFSTFLMHSTFNAAGTLLAYLLPIPNTAEFIVFLIIGIPMIAAGFYLLRRTYKAEKTVKPLDGTYLPQ